MVHAHLLFGAQVRNWIKGLCGFLMLNQIPGRRSADLEDMDASR